MIKNIHKLYILILLISISNIGICQNQTSRLKIITGGNVSFIFNSFKKYDNGIIYTDYTKLAVYYIDTTDSGVHQATTWQLDFKANSANIEGTGTNNLALATLELTATDGGGNLSASHYYAKPLTNSDATLVDTGPEGDFNDNLINITYECGKTVKVLNEKPDYYVVDIIFTVSPQ